MAAITFSTSNQTFRQLFGNGLTYSVPRFQRDYSWTEEECDELWQDIHGVLEEGGEDAHYMGYLVLQSLDNKTFEIVDGQQRLTTLSIMVLAVLKVIDDLVSIGISPDENRRRAEQLRSSYIGYLDPVTLVARPKLKLNRNNDDYYRDYIIPLAKLPARNLRESDHLLRKAFEFFYSRLKQEYLTLQDGKLLASFLDRLSDKLFFTVIVVSNQLNAFKVFETLNARGVRLSPTDLLKNYLFSVVDRGGIHSIEIETLERRWEAMVGRLGGENFSEFLRAHWNSRQVFVRESDLFKSVRSRTPDRAAVFDLIQKMEQDIDTYAALSAPADPIWTGDERKHISALRIFGIRQPWPMLLAARRSYVAADFLTLLRACVVVSLRYNVIAGLIPRAQELVYNRIAQGIVTASLSANDAVRALAEIYPRDNEFRASFANKVLATSATRNKNVAKLILFEIERHVSNRDLDRDSALYNLEHVLPENPKDRWAHFSDIQVRDNLYRLGNLTILESARNRDVGNADFETKRGSYEKSGIEITRRIAEENSGWNPERINVRQEWMAAQAAAIWRIAQLHP